MDFSDDEKEQMAKKRKKKGKVLVNAASGPERDNSGISNNSFHSRQRGVDKNSLSSASSWGGKAGFQHFNVANFPSHHGVGMGIPMHVGGNSYAGTYTQVPMQQQPLCYSHNNVGYRPPIPMGPYPTHAASIAQPQHYAQQFYSYSAAYPHAGWPGIYPSSGVHPIIQATSGVSSGSYYSQGNFFINCNMFHVTLSLYRHNCRVQYLFVILIYLFCY